MNQMDTRRSLMSLMCAAGLVLAAACSTPSAPNQVDEAEEEPEGGDSTSLLIPAPDRTAPDLLRLHDGQPLA